MADNFRVIDASKESLGVAGVRSSLERKIVGQRPAIDFLIGLVEKYNSRLYDPTKPIGSCIMTGPSGVGKTRMVESFCEALVGSTSNLLKIDCAEFQHSHEIARLIGSPPGYLGHRETPPFITTARITDICRSLTFPFGIILLDEIEKASDALWQLLLGVLDKGVLTLGTNERVDMTRTIILMTSNVGSSEMGTSLGFTNLGFTAGERVVNDTEIARIGQEAVKRKFAVEFVNRLDGIVACHALTRTQIAEVLNREIALLQQEAFVKCTGTPHFVVSPAAREALLTEGYDPKYNARHVKRAIDVHLRLPIGRIIARGELHENEVLVIDHNGTEFTFGAQGVTQTATEAK